MVSKSSWAYSPTLPVRGALLDEGQRSFLGVLGADDPLAECLGQDLPSSSGRSRVLWMASRVPRTASGALELTMSAISWARSRSFSCSTTSVIMPELVGALGAHPFVLAHQRHP